MIAIKPGRIYDLRNFKSDKTQRIVFTHRLETGEYVEGTTNEEVLDMLLNRLYELQSSGFDAKNQVAIDNLKNAKAALKKRSRRKRVKYYGDSYKNH